MLFTSRHGPGCHCEHCHMQSGRRQLMVSRLGCMLGENARHGLSVGQGTREWSACALSVKLYRRQRGAVRRARSPRHMGKASRTAGKRGRLPGCHVKDSSGRGAVAAGRWRVDPASPSFGVVNRSAPSLLALGLALAALLPSVLEAKVAALACLPAGRRGRGGMGGQGAVGRRAEWAAVVSLHCLLGGRVG